MANYKSAWVKLGEELLAGKKIDRITLRGKEYRFSYTEDEFRAVAVNSNWDTATIDEWSKKYIPVQGDFICDFKSDFCLNSGGYGCIHGDTKITTDKGDVSIKELYAS